MSLSGGRCVVYRGTCLGRPPCPKRPPTTSSELTIIILPMCEYTRCYRSVARQAAKHVSCAATHVGCAARMWAVPHARDCD